MVGKFSECLLEKDVTQKHRDACRTIFVVDDRGGKPKELGLCAWNRRKYDIGNVAIWTLGAGVVRFAADPPSSPRWTGGILFDDDIRDGLRKRSRGGRDTADDVSDWLLVSSAVWPLLFDTAVKTWGYDSDKEKAFDLTVDWAESMSLALFLSESTKVVVGRQRPFAKGCDGDADYAKDCGDSDEENDGFYSGHAAMAGAGAGVTCANARKHHTWGDGTASWVVPCGLAGAAAIATGVLRIVADEHWSTDVLVGLPAGLLIGYFDVPGPADLLRFRIKDLDGDGQKGVARILPTAAPGAIGLRLTITP